MGYNDELLQELRKEARLIRVMATALRHLDRMQAVAQLIVEMAAEAFATPMAVVSLLYSDHDQVLAAVGMEVGDYDWNVSYCQHLVMERSVLAIDDSTVDVRVSQLVGTVNGTLRTYLGAPLVAEGHVIGSLCVCDNQVRHWTAIERDTLSSLATSLMAVDAQMAYQASILPISQNP